MSNPKVSTIAQDIAEDIGLCFGVDDARIFKNLTHVQNEIWKSGKFYDSTKWFDCKLMPNNQIITPHGYDTILGIDINGKPRQMKDEYFLFHENGPGDISRLGNQCKGWLGASNIQYLGASPVLLQPTDEACRTRHLDCNPKRIVVKADCATYDPPYPRTVVSGFGVDGRPIYSYESIPDIDKPKEVVTCQCSKQDFEESGTTEIIEGVQFQIGPVPQSPDIKFTRINNIVKEPTPYPVEYWMVSDTSLGCMIARMEPNQVLSSYKIYIVPRQCSTFRTVLCLFKRSKPEPIRDGNQIFISDNLEAIKSLSIACDYKYTKKNIQASAPYFADAAGQLNAELKENRPTNNTPIQVESFQGYVNFPKM